MDELDSRPIIGKRNRDADLGYAILRLTLGLDFLFHSASRWPHVGQFLDKTVGQFGGTPLPSWSVRWYSIGILICEPLVGLLLFIGFRTRGALVAGGLLVATLVFGTALRGDFTVLAEQLIYALLFFLLMRHRQENDRWSVDRIVARQSRAAKA